MAKKGREAALKRARERARQEKQEAKREKRFESEPVVEISRADENALMEEFARLSASFEADQITPQRFAEERERIFTELGIEAPPG